MGAAPMRLILAFTSLAFTWLTPAQAADRPIQFAATAPAQGALAIPLQSKADLARLTLLDAASRTMVERALDAEEFDYAAKSKLTLRSSGPWSKILLIGTGPGPISASGLQDIGGIAAQELGTSSGPITIVAPASSAAANAEAEIALGARLGGYSFDKYKFADPAKPVPAGRSAPITIVGGSAAARDVHLHQGQALAEAVSFARDLATEPANVIYPASFVERTRQALRGVRGVTIRVLDVAEMERLGMGSILSVGKGSARPPRMLVVDYRGAANAPLVALAGKGITFDSGGISLKPGTGMWAMKGDMGGAAAVIGTAVSLAKSQAPVNVVAIAALAENMPGGAASRPGDVVKAYNGRTIEILNTDAEGRLVLADAVAFAERVYKPAAIVDVATLTGAVNTALGDEYAGLFSRSDPLAAQLLAAGAATGEELWRLPLHRNYAMDMKSDIADIKNVVEGGAPGAGLGAHFIGYFVATTPWAHLDIASVDRRSSSLPTVPEGFSAFGVRLLDRFVRSFRPVPPAASVGTH
jgi:leucyl aminopeptidase